MQVDHLAIDGSVVSMGADTDLSGKPTATGWAIVPSLMQSHPFGVHPAGHSSVVEETVISNFPEAKIHSTEEYSLKGGKLRVGVVEVPAGAGGTRKLTVGAWEGENGCLSTSLVGDDRDRLVEVFDTLDFKQGARGVSIESPVVPRPRPPEVIMQVPELGVISVRPAIASELERLPKSPGRRTRHGELFRLRADRNALILVTRSSVVSITPRKDADAQRMVAVADDFNVEWTPKVRRRR